jgi:hypothetical protein
MKLSIYLMTPFLGIVVLFSRPFLSKTVMRQFQTCLMVQCRFAVAFYGSRASSQLVALVPQEEELADGLQLEPPGMHLIYLPYADDIRPTEKYHICSEASVPRASKEQVEAAAAFINKMKLDSWSVFDISDPGDL